MSEINLQKYMSEAIRRIMAKAYHNVLTNPLEVEDGFLLPNDDNHVGEGFVSFGINHLADLANGTAITNEATIIFDANAAI